MKSPKCWTSPLANKQETVPSSCWEILDVSGWEKHPSKKGEKKKERRTPKGKGKAFTGNMLLRAHKPTAQAKESEAVPTLPWPWPCLLCLQLALRKADDNASCPIQCDWNHRRLDLFPHRPPAKPQAADTAASKWYGLSYSSSSSFSFFFPTICLEIDRLWK